MPWTTMGKRDLLAWPPTWWEVLCRSKGATQSLCTSWHQVLLEGSQKQPAHTCCLHSVERPHFLFLEVARLRDSSRVFVHLLLVMACTHLVTTQCKPQIKAAAPRAAAGVLATSAVQSRERSDSPVQIWVKYPYIIDDISKTFSISTDYEGHIRRFIVFRRFFNCLIKRMAAIDIWEPFPEASLLSSLT